MRFFAINNTYKWFKFTYHQLFSCVFTHSTLNNITKTIINTFIIINTCGISSIPSISTNIFIFIFVYTPNRSIITSTSISTKIITSIFIFIFIFICIYNINAITRIATSTLAIILDIKLTCIILRS